MVRRYLAVANQTLGGDDLLARVKERMLAGPSHFHMLVPATPASQLDQEYVASVPEHLRIAATAQPGDGEVGVADPLVTGPAHAAPQTTKE